MTDGRAVRLSGAIGCFFLFLTLPVLLFPGIVPASGQGVSDPTSLHNFAVGTEPGNNGNGACAFCHQVHYGPEQEGNLMIWARDLTEEAGYLDQTGSSTEPNYLQYFYYDAGEPKQPGGTIGCYDCHDDSGFDSSPLIDSNETPNQSDWSTADPPQNIAFGDTATNGSVPSETGYYEMQGGYVPNKGGPLAVPTIPTFPPVRTPTGGHYWKGVMETTNVLDAPFRFGDKMPCTICHDVHDTGQTGGNEVFIWTTIDAGSDGTIDMGSIQSASSASRTGTGDGRALCAACHLYEDSSGNEEMFGVTIPRPPPISFLGHDSSDVQECTACHPHNSPDCGACHGNPPPIEAAGYGTIVESQGPHPRHANDLNDPDPGYEFDCAFCHRTFGTIPHPNGDFDDVAFDTTKNPGATYSSQTCTDLYCHSRGARLADTQSATATDPQWTGSAGEDWSVQDIGCEACHGPTGARVLVSPFPADYGAPGYSNQTQIPAGGGNEKANSHYEHTTVMGYGCPTCHVTVVTDTDPPNHDWAILDETLHVNNTSASFTFDVVAADNGPANPFFDSYAYNAAGGTCTNIDCHGGTDAQWGDAAVGLNCEACHVRTEAAGGDLDTWGLPDGTASWLSEEQWVGTGHGRTAGWYPWPDNQGSFSPAGLACLSSDPTSPTGGCHIAEPSHRLATNPFRLATPESSAPYSFEWPDNTIDDQSLNTFCAVCHATIVAQEHSEAITGVHNTNDWPSSPDPRNNFKCSDCHDPHGDGLDPGSGPDYMVHGRVYTGSSDDYGVPLNPGTDILPASGSIDFDVTTPLQVPGDYVDTGAAADDKICQVCHLANPYFRRDQAPTAHNPGVQCMQCHSHDEGFKATACEVCHSVDTLYVGDYPDPGDAAAPNVMGPGNDPLGTGGTPKPYDNGTFGANVNGHGSNGTALAPIGGYAPAIDVECEICHNVAVPANTHLDGTLDGYTPDPANNNPFHLVAGFINTSPAQQYSVQVDFDDYCATTCHTGKDMRHGKDNNPVANAMRFGDHHSYPFPSNTPPPNMFYDVNLTYLAPGGLGDPPHFGPCISCHDPHGTNVVSPRSDDVNFMVIYRWKNPDMLCAKCHP